MDSYFQYREITIDQNYDGLYAYFQYEYLYSSNFEGGQDIILELLKIADEYQDLHLKKMCENRAKYGITVANVADLYSMALKLDSIKDLGECCVLFASKHIGEMIETSGFTKWDVNTTKTFMRDCLKQKSFRYFELWGQYKLKRQLTKYRCNMYEYILSVSATRQDAAS